MIWFDVVKGGNQRTATAFQTESIRRTLLRGDASTKEILTAMRHDWDRENVERLSGKFQTEVSGKRRRMRILSSRQIPIQTSLHAILFRHPFVERRGKLWGWIGD